MKIQSLAPNQTQVCLSNGTIVFVSYSTCVGCFIPGKGCFKTTQFWSNITSRHLNKWCIAQTSTPATTQPQEFFDDLIAKADVAPDNSITLAFANADDAKYVRNYIADAKAKDGTVTGLSAGLMCSALRRCTTL